MKKIFLVFCLLTVVLTSNALAVINQIVVTELNDSTFVAITIPLTNGKCRPVTAWTETGVAFEFATDLAGTDAATIPAPGTYSNSCVTTDGTGIVFYARSTSGTINLAVNYGKNL